MVKCKYCDEVATRVTKLFTLEGLGKKKLRQPRHYSTEPVCDKHYFEYEHGFQEIKHCDKTFYIPVDYYYPWEYGETAKFYCPFCKKLVFKVKSILEAEWVDEETGEPCSRGYFIEKALGGIAKSPEREGSSESKKSNS